MNSYSEEEIKIILEALDQEIESNKKQNPAFSAECMDIKDKIRRDTEGKATKFYIVKDGRKV